MPVYTLASKELLNDLNEYTQKGEEVKISEELEYNNILYKEVMFTKKKSGKEHIGYLFINENNEVIAEKSLQEKLAKLAHFAEMLYNTENKSCIVNTYGDEASIEKDINDQKIIGEGLDFLTSGGIKDLEEVKQIVIKLTDIRKKNNEVLKRIMDITKVNREEKKYFNDLRLEELLPIYREALSVNLQKIRLVHSQRNSYANIKVISDKKRKSISVRFNSKLTKPLSKLSLVMDYFTKLVNSCETISKMSDSKYFKYLDTIEKENIKFRVKMNRSKKNS